MMDSPNVTVGGKVPPSLRVSPSKLMVEVKAELSKRTKERVPEPMVNEPLSWSGLAKPSTT